MEWLEKLFNYGVPTAILVFVIWQIGRGARWLGPTIQDWFTHSIATQDKLAENSRIMRELLQQTSMSIMAHERDCAARSKEIHKDVKILREAASEACKHDKEVKKALDRIESKLEDAGNGIVN